MSNMCSRPHFVAPYLLAALENPCEREHRIMREVGVKTTGEYKRLLQRSCPPVPCSCRAQQRDIISVFRPEQSGGGGRGSMTE
jgi:hypothetical protein